jgi:hypothetical protein
MYTPSTEVIDEYIRLDEEYSKAFNGDNFDEVCSLMNILDIMARTEMRKMAQSRKQELGK